MKDKIVLDYSDRLNIIDMIEEFVQSGNKDQLMDSIVTYLNETK